MNIYELATRAAELDGAEAPAEWVVDLIIMATARKILAGWSPIEPEALEDAVHDVRTADFDDGGEPA